MGPWHRYKGAEDADGVVPEGVEPVEDRKEEVKPKERQEGPRIVIETKERVPRRF